MSSMAEDGATTQISVRLDAKDLEQLERIGRQLQPVPANRSQMIGVAIREYLSRQSKKKLRPSDDPRDGGPK